MEDSIMWSQNQEMDRPIQTIPNHPSNVPGLPVNSSNDGFQVENTPLELLDFEQDFFSILDGEEREEFKSILASREDNTNSNNRSAVGHDIVNNPDVFNGVGYNDNHNNNIDNINNILDQSGNDYNMMGASDTSANMQELINQPEYDANDALGGIDEGNIDMMNRMNIDKTATFNPPQQQHSTSPSTTSTPEPNNDLSLEHLQVSVPRPQQLQKPSSTADPLSLENLHFNLSDLFLHEETMRPQPGPGQTVMTQTPNGANGRRAVDFYVQESGGARVSRMPQEEGDMNVNETGSTRGNGAQPEYSTWSCTFSGFGENSASLPPVVHSNVFFPATFYDKSGAWTGVGSTLSNLDATKNESPDYENKKKHEEKKVKNKMAARRSRQKKKDNRKRERQLNDKNVKLHDELKQYIAELQSRYSVLSDYLEGYKTAVDEANEAAEADQEMEDTFMDLPFLEYLTPPNTTTGTASSVNDFNQNPWSVDGPDDMDEEDIVNFLSKTN